VQRRFKFPYAPPTDTRRRNTHLRLIGTCLE
jgi:hypothetical protein